TGAKRRTLAGPRRWRSVSIKAAQRSARSPCPHPDPLPLAGEGKGGSPTRYYYLVEDLAGHRFWLYREGLYGRETAAARWFVQGLFA
ncbi:MAG: hypothetical protein WA661_19990, partial [Xanthobacteraceae bacterium]